MKFILLYVALNATPTMLGSYDSINSCNNAIRAIFITQSYVPGLQYSQQQQNVINRAIDVQLQYQQDYVCVAKK
jgi:hypothetical protein